MRTIMLLIAIGMCIGGSPGAETLPTGQGMEKEAVPVAVQWLLDAANPSQKTPIRSVFMLVCPATSQKGTAFLLSTGIVVSNEHVVKGCTPENLWAQSALGSRITFSRLLVDVNRDLAILRPVGKLEGGLELAAPRNPALEDKVSTWGYPLRYQGNAPILSVGYVAGFNSVSRGGRTVKRLIVNGAFNPGNSGGPLLDAHGRLIGVVVAKWTLFSPQIEAAIHGFKKPASSTRGTFTQTLPDGTQRSLSDQEVLSIVLEEFYSKVQVFVGEAISISELQSFIREKESEL